MLCISLLNVSTCDIHFSKIQKGYYPTISKVNVQLYRGGQFFWSRKAEDPAKNHRPITSHWQPLPHKVVYLALIEIPAQKIRYLETQPHVR
jgi:hypothetical protein